jgi:hypothetical protein
MFRVHLHFGKIGEDSTDTNSKVGVKILVAIKPVPNPVEKVKMEDGSGIVRDNIKMVVKPFCEIAVEEALRFQ